MRRILVLVLACICGLMPAATAGAAPTWSAKDVLGALIGGDTDGLYRDMDKSLQAAIGSPEAFAGTWAQLEGMFGAYASMDEPVTVKDGTQYTVCAHFATADVTLLISYSDAGKLAGLTVGGVEWRNQAQASTDDSGEYVEEPVTLRNGQSDATNGCITWPLGNGPFPAVIMMQGSGPSDMHESAYGMAPFRDMARGLAARGVASIRYDKYTYAHADKVGADFTVDDEYARDAQEAYALLAGDERVSGVYLLGHSLGAMLVPRVTQALGDNAVKGGILIAGTPNHLWEIQVRQNEDLLTNMDADTAVQGRAALDAEIAKLDALRDMSAEALARETFFGAPAVYQLDEMSVDAAETAIRLGMRLFIAQGGKDWQVRPDEGIDLWQAAFDGRLDATYALYPDMTHMLFTMDGESTGTTQDYIAHAAPVSQALIDDIAQWVLNGTAQ